MCEFFKNIRTKMDFFPVIKSQMQLLFITIVLGTTTAAPCFGVDFPAPNRDVMTGSVEISPPNPWPSSSNSQKSNSPFGLTKPNPHSPFGNPFPRVDNSNNSPSSNFFNPSPMEFIDTVKTIPEKSIELISTLRQKLTENSNESKNEPIPEKGAEEATLEWSDAGSDYTTETSEYETTTDTDEFNRIGGPAPAVVASLLG